MQDDVIGIDLGGTKIELIRLASNGDVVERHREATIRGNYNNLCDQICKLIQRMQNGATLPVGMGIPGSVSAVTGLIRNANTTELNGHNLVNDIAERLGQQIRIANDANCFALSEAIDGAGRDRKTVWGIILGTGIGSGIVIDGKVLQGANGIGGEWGHNPVPWRDESYRPTKACFCGKRDCIELWLSGPGLSRWHHHHFGEHLSAADIYIAANKKGCYNAKATLEWHITHLAKALAQVINILDPDVIVLGGGLSNMDHLYTDLPELIKPWVFSDAATITIRAPQFGDASGVRGAAWLTRQ